MMQLDNPERVHVGKALRQHATELGVTQGGLDAAAGDSSRQELKWAFAAADLSVLRIRWVHFVTIEAYEHLDDKPAVSVGFREQWYSTSKDEILYHQVLAGGRRSVWWWGAARTPRGTGALCYVCDELIHTYDLTRGVTHPVRLSVMNHRAEHVAKMLGITTTAHGRKRT